MKKLQDRLQVNVTPSAAFMVASTLVNGANFLYHVVVSRGLDTASYGALGALLGLLLVFAVPSTALQIAVTKEVASRNSDGPAGSQTILIGPLLSKALACGLVATLVIVAMVPLIASFLHLPNMTAALLLALYTIPSVLGIVPKGVLLGQRRFRLVAAAMVAGSCTRLVLGAFLSSERGLEGAMGAIVLGELLTVLLLLPALRRFVSVSALVQPLRVHWREGVAALVAFSGFWALTAVDTLLARHFLSADQSGFYAAAATAARSVMFLPAAVAAILLPQFALGNGRSSRARSALMRGLVLVSSMSVPAALFLMLFSEFSVGLLFGDRYMDATGPLRILAITSVAFGLVNLLMYFHISSNARMPAALPWVGVWAAVGGIVVFHENMVQIALVMLIVVSLLLVAMAYIAFGRSARDRQQAAWLGKTNWRTDKAELDLTMVVPYYNPGPGVVATIKRLDEALQSANITYEIIAVSDGSIDQSETLLRQAEIAGLKLVALENNVGKGHALRLGLSMGKGEYLGFIDADGDVDPRLLTPYLQLVKMYQPDIVLGSKRHPMSDVHYPFIRYVYSWGYQVLTYLLFRTRVRDTQTGLKLMRREVLGMALPLMLEKRFAFDLELLVVAKHLGFSRFFEAPIKIDHQFTSTVSAGTVRGMLLDTLAIFYRLHFLRSYDRRDVDDLAPHDHR